jgi:hypothetical protein
VIDREPKGLTPGSRLLTGDHKVVVHAEPDDTPIFADKDVHIGSFLARGFTEQLHRVSLHVRLTRHAPGGLATDALRNQLANDIDTDTLLANLSIRVLANDPLNLGANVRLENVILRYQDPILGRDEENKF